MTVTVCVHASDRNELSHSMGCERCKSLRNDEWHLERSAAVWKQLEYQSTANNHKTYIRCTLCCICKKRWFSVLLPVNNLIKLNECRFIHEPCVFIKLFQITSRDISTEMYWQLVIPSHVRNYTYSFFFFLLSQHALAVTLYIGFKYRNWLENGHGANQKHRITGAGPYGLKIIPLLKSAWVDSHNIFFNQIPIFGYCNSTAGLALVLSQNEDTIHHQ